MITFRSSLKLDKPAAVVLISQAQVNNRMWGVLKDPSLKNQVEWAVKAGHFSGESGELFSVTSKGKIIVLAGVEDKGGLTALRATLRRALFLSALGPVKEVEIFPHHPEEETIKALIEGIMIGVYSWRKYKSKAPKDKKIHPSDKKYFVAAVQRQSYVDAMTICDGVNFTRDLINDNADTVTSDHIERVVRGLVRGRKNISVKVLNRKELKANRLGLHLAVNQGSSKEPKLIIVRYDGAPRKSDYTAFIGKGMTFDTGGLNLKTSGHIETMRIDMSGAAAVAGTLKNTIALGIKKNVLFVFGLAENSIGPDAYKPGDVICGYAGKTVEVANTDAEGRLVLADAISYVVKNYKPARIIDIATLTGACVVALGHDYSGLMTTDDQFSRQLIHSSNATDDRIWRLPIYPELKDSVRSKIADIRNLGFPRGAAGTITAAEFLRQFTQETPWAHLDIAGTAYFEDDGRMYYGHGATGAGVRLVTHYLQNQ